MPSGASQTPRTGRLVLSDPLTTGRPIDNEQSGGPSEEDTVNMDVVIAETDCVHGVIPPLAAPALHSYNNVVLKEKHDSYVTESLGVTQLGAG